MDDLRKSWHKWGLLALVSVLCLQCSRSELELPTIEGWTGEPQVAAKIERARRNALDDPDSADKLGRLGMIFQAHDLHTEAVECYRQAAALAPQDARWTYLAALSKRVDDFESAVKLFEQAAARGADHAAFHVNFGDVLARLGRAEKASEEYRRALERDPSVTHALYGLAQLALGRGDTQEARGLLEKAAEIAPWHGEARALLAQTYRRLGRSEDADRELEAAGAYPDATQAADPVYQPVEAEAVTAVAYTTRARRLAQEGQYAEAETLYRRILEVRTGIAGDYSNLGGALAGQGKIDEAIVFYRKALELDADDPYALNNLAMALAERRDPEGAIKHLSKAVEIEPRYPEAHHNLGLVRASQKRYAEAIVHYREALAHNPSFARVHNDLGTALAALGRISEAITSWRRALEIDSREMSALYNLAVGLSQAGEHAEAMEWLSKGLDLAPNSSRLTAFLAWELATAPQEELRDGAKAVVMAKRVYDAYPNQPGMGNIFAAALAETGEFEAATEVAGRAVDQALRAGERTLATQIGQSLQGYREGRPVRQAN